MGAEIGAVFLAPGGAVGVLEHDPHPDPLPLLGDQGFGHPGQGQLLNRDQHFAVGGVNRRQQHCFEIVAGPVLLADGTAVVVVGPVVEGHGKARWQGQGLGGLADDAAGLAATGQRQAQAGR